MSATFAKQPVSGILAMSVTGYLFCARCGCAALRPGVNKYGFKVCPECLCEDVRWCPPVFAPELTPTNQVFN